MCFFLSIPCFPTLSFLITVVSAHWSRSKCFSRSGEQGVCVMVCVHEEEEEEVCAIGEGTQVQSLLFTSQGLLRHTWPLLSVLTVWFCVCMFACACLCLTQMFKHQSSCLCAFLTIVCPFVRRPVSSDVHLLWSAHLRVIMKATFDFNLSWNLLLLSQVTLSSRLAHVLLFLFLQVPLSQNRANSTAAAVQKWHFSKVGQSLAKVTQGLDYNTPFFSDCVFMALWIFTLNPIWITLCKASLETAHQRWHLKK